MTEPSTHQPPASGAPTPALSAGTLFYLWGDRVVQPAGRFGAATLPSGARVSEKELSAVVFAASFWRLRQVGALQLQEVTKKALGLVKQQHVQVAMGHDTSFKAGYEDAIMRQVAAGATTAYDVVQRWFGKDFMDPQAYALSLATREMLASGLAHEVDTGRTGVSGVLMGRTTIQPDLTRIPSTWTAFEQTHAGWMQFRHYEPTLATTLVETCMKAIRSRQDSPDVHN